MVRCWYILVWLWLGSSQAMANETVTPYSYEQLQQAYQDYAAYLTPQTLQQHSELLHRLENWAPEQQCSAAQLALATQILQRNPSSITVRYLRYQCWLQSQPQLAAQELEMIVLLVDILLTSGPGLNVEHPLKLREVGEAYTLFELSGLQVVEIEMISNHPKLLFRFYLRDEETQAFSYRYVDNFDWLKIIIDLSRETPLQEQQYATAALQMFLKNRYAFARLLQARILLLKQEGDSAITLLRELVDESYLATSLLAQVYLQQQNTTALAALTSELEQAHQLGEPSASAFFSLQFLLENTTEHAVTAAQHVLFEFARDGEQQLRHEMLLELISRQPQQEALLQRWFANTQDPAAFAALKAVAQRLQGEQTGLQRIQGHSWYRLWSDFQTQIIKE